MKTLINNLILCTFVSLTTGAIATAQVPQIRGTYQINGGHNAEVVQNSGGITLYYQVPQAFVLMNAEYGQCVYTAPNGQLSDVFGFHGFFKTTMNDGLTKEGCCRIFPTHTHGEFVMQTYFWVNNHWKLENSVAMVNVNNRPSFPPAPDWDRTPSQQPQPHQPLSNDHDEFQLVPAGLDDLGI